MATEPQVVEVILDVAWKEIESSPPPTVLRLHAGGKDYVLCKLVQKWTFRIDGRVEKWDDEEWQFVKQPFDMSVIKVKT